jgi:hypothetical protein
VPSATPIIAFSSVSCAHERGPGTSVCLRCRAEAHAASAARLRRTLARVGVAAIVLLIAAGIGAGAITADSGTVPPHPVASVTPATANVVSQGEPLAAPASSEPVSAPVSAPVPGPTTTPVIDAERTELPDGMYADRQGGEVTVHFDTELARTRRRDKFENVVRQTLPVIFGTRADSILAAVPAGEIVHGGDLLSELPARGIQLPPSGGWSIMLWPETRPGRDGPLVVSYRASIAPAR